MPSERRPSGDGAIGPARKDERAALEALLTASSLPTAGFADHLDTALVAREAERLLGCVALECYGDDVLLRSLAVEPSARGLGLGQRLTSAALALARELGGRRVWLLTTTAERFFPRFGFERVERGSLPAALGASTQLSGACPDSAIPMRLGLEAGGG